MIEKKNLDGLGFTLDPKKYYKICHSIADLLNSHFAHLLQHYRSLQAFNVISIRCPSCTITRKTNVELGFPRTKRHTYLSP